MKMVDEAISEIKGEVEKIEIDPDINLPLSAFIPEDYINDSNLRLTLYRRLINAEDEDRLNDLSTEISDRFGPPPDEVKDLFGVMGVRLLAKDALITGLRYKKGTINMTFHEDAKLDTEKIVSLVTSDSDRFGITPDGILRFRPPSKDKNELLISLRNILQILIPYVKK
jgi:transcription-repair coupling factor (superfamily II helicase)